MNEIYVSGKAVSVSVLHSEADGKAHLMLLMRVSHQNRRKIVKHELFVVHAWNSLATWAEQIIKPGKSVMVSGYLSQRASDGENHVEITAKHIWLDHPDSSGDQAHNLPET